MTATRDIGQGPGTVQRRVTFRTDTPERYRSFRLRTLAAMIHAETNGPSITHRSARAQARELLGIPETQEGRRTPTADLIARLFDEALALDTKLPGQG